MKLDTFTWVVIGLVVLLLGAAVVTVNRTDGAGWGENADYISEDVPEAPVYNAFLAVQQGDLTRAREQYSAQMLEEIGGEDGYDPFSGRGSNSGSRRMQIVNVEIVEDDPARALVTFSIDNYNRGGGIFGSGSTWSYENTVEVIREDDAWKLNAEEFFY